MDNHTYDLVKALGEKGESLQVYETYAKDTDGCEACSKLWGN